MLKRQRKIVSVAVALSLIVAMGTGLAGKTAKAAIDYGISNPVTDSNGVTTWDKVKFGSYYQTAEFKTEPIKWRVLSVDGDDAFLLADENLDCQPYNTIDEDVTWETCSLRKWLNEDFYNEAFSDSEQAAIRETKVVNKDNPEYGTAGGNDTMDRIYLLSLDEVENKAYGFVSHSERESKNTDYVKCQTVYSSSEGNGSWWLRSPGGGSNGASIVYRDGHVYQTGDYVDSNDRAVRPALHLNLSSSVYTDAGEVDSEGNVTNKDDGIHAPVRDSEGVTTWECVYLGKYKQKTEWKKEPIEWRVLSVDGDDAFLLADKNLDCEPYNTKKEAVTWETCSLRKWLNEDFYNEAFSSSEQAAIMETEVVNKDNPEYGTLGGNDTTDRIYLLSLDEAGNAEYGFTSLDTRTKTRESKNTDYAKCNHAESSSKGNGYWWLRSPGNYSYYASGVSDCGYVYWDGDPVSNSNIPVRPTLHLNLFSSSWSKSGQVSSGGSEALPQASNLPQTTDAPTVTVSPIPTSSGESPSASENPKPSASPEQAVTTPTLASDLPQITNAPSVTVSPIPTSSGESSSANESPSASESPSAGESPKPGGTPGQTETAPPLAGTPSLTGTPSLSTNPPQMTNTPSVTAFPVATANSADTGKLGKVSIKSAKNSKKSVVVLTWKKVNGASGYQIQYALDQKFAKGMKTKTTAGTSYTLKKLKKKKTYYVRIRALKKVGSKNVYGAWSKVKKVKIKK